MNRLTLTLLAATLLCGAVIYHQHQSIRGLASDREALLEDVTLYRTKAERSAASATAMSLTINELREHRSDLEAIIRDLRLKLRRVESIATTVATTTLRDTIVIHDTLPHLIYDDGHTSLRSTISSNIMLWEFRSTDTIHQVVHRVPRRWLGIPIGTKGIRQEMVSTNPNTTLVYAEYIELRGRRRAR